MIEKIINVASDFEDADRIAREQDNEMTPLDRLAAYMKLMEPYYAAAPDFKEFVALVIDANVRFVTIGALHTTCTGARERPVISTSLFR